VSERVLVIDLNRDSEYKQILDGQPRTCGLRSGRVYLEPVQVCDQHSTNANEEMLVFLSGEGQALIGHEEYPYQVSEGKVLYIPPHTLHNVKNTGTEPLIYIYCVAPVTQCKEVK